MGGFTSLYSVNAGVYTEIFRACWNGSVLTTNLEMGTKTLTRGTVNCSSLILGAPTITGSTTVNQTSSTLPTSGTQIGFLYSDKPTALQSIGGWVVTTSATAITALAYPTPAIEVWITALANPTSMDHCSS